jgi:hypothetical protein
MRTPKKIVIVFCLLIASVFFVLGATKSSIYNKETSLQNDLKDGDIIFQTSQSDQCEAVRIATNSKFSHCGIIYIENGEPYVYEAVQPVKMTLLSDWITHGKDSKYLVKRLQNSERLLNKEVLSKMKAYGSQFNKKDYDLYFEWSNDKIYCSELVWKIYKEGAGIELCNLQKLKEFNLSHPKVKAILKQRYGNAIPYEESVVAPSQLVNSDQLITVFDTY